MSAQRRLSGISSGPGSLISRDVGYSAERDQPRYDGHSGAGWAGGAGGRPEWFLRLPRWLGAPWSKRSARRDRQCRGIPCLGSGQLRQRRGFPGRWRPGPDLTATQTSVSQVKPAIWSQAFVSPRSAPSPEAGESGSATRRTPSVPVTDSLIH